MTKLYDKSPAKAAKTENPEQLLNTISTFVNACRRPAVLEYGEEPIPLKPGEYVLEIRAGRLGLEVWDETRCISRRILAVERISTAVLDCTVQRFGGKCGKLTVLDLDRPQAAHRSLIGNRQSFAEKFRRMLSRQFPDWEITTLSSGLDLQRSFSSRFPRAWLTRANRAIAAMACPAEEDEAAMLTFALLWHGYLRKQSPPQDHLSLALFLPEGAGNLTAHRLRWLTGASLRFTLFLFNQHGSAGEVDPDDLGNLQTRVASQYAPPQIAVEIRKLLDRLRTIDGVGWSPELNGSLSISCRGLEFARIEGGRILLGLEERRELSACHTEDVEHFAMRLSGLSARSPAAFAPRVFPERWFETAVRSHLTSIYPELITDTVHAQVLSFAATNRDLIDLLAVTRSGRLVVLELKAAEDIQLPFQAMDYWMRIRWHAERGELQHLFPGVAVMPLPPILLLVAPAMTFHPATESVLRYFASDIEVERVGVNTEWQKRFQVVLRLRGAEVPASHRSSE
ncbi:MAG: hypothetical protein JOY54_14980 [Acidobacteriaceae bacterium]|nr:hypothetical protein [Acidobacteriaceae bacterium]